MKKNRIKEMLDGVFPPNQQASRNLINTDQKVGLNDENKIKFV